MTGVVIAIGALAVCGWLSAFVHGVWSLAHLSGKSSLGQMLLHGIRWFDSENFTPRGQALQRRFMRSLLTFVAAVFGLIVVAALTSSARR